MVHDVPSRRKARELMIQAGALVKESKTLAGIDDAEIMITDRENKAIGLKEEAGKLALYARLEDLTVREDPLVKVTKKGERTYYRWVASWREDGRCRKVYVGSCRKMSKEEALQKARGMKAKALAEDSQRSERDAFFDAISQCGGRAAQPIRSLQPGGRSR